ncbi:hypothetical protein Acr_00g0053240 [Actinidia rufa]|uniref:Uncharacterized protein n=1 Tax=Actinidia rufa TaxID=165716 RepID=A0A7J0DLB1_9ERIC|nr:hypothetical protein Acr_00g0053240 [Actinidia rufa]
MVTGITFTICNSDFQITGYMALVVYLLLLSKKHPKEFAEELTKEADQYNGFNLIITDLSSKTMLYITNKPKEKISIIEVSPGMHVLSNATLDSPWPKAERLRNGFNDLLDVLVKGHYGTRSTSAVSFKTSGEVNFYERSLEKEVWKEKTFTYQVEKMK